MMDKISFKLWWWEQQDKELKIKMNSDQAKVYKTKKKLGGEHE